MRRHPGEARIEIGGGAPARPFPPVLSRSFPGVTSERYKLASSAPVAFPGNQTGGTPFMFARRSVAEAEDTLAWIRAQLEPATDLADLKARPRCAVARCDRSKHRMFGRAAPRRAPPRRDKMQPARRAGCRSMRDSVTWSLAAIKLRALT